jgi:predicted HAD superfamily Cof-like phosphohydrolase
MNIREQVTEFHEVFGQPIKKAPEVPEDARVRLRASLILEEALETIEALFSSRSGITVFPHDVIYASAIMSKARKLLKALIDQAEVAVNIVELADGLADLDYVVEGTRLEFGIDGGLVADEVHRSNMAKSLPCSECHGRGDVPHYFEGHFNGGWENCPSCKGAGRIVKRREDGKILKPDTWTPPDIAGVLRKQGWHDGDR